jgi:hypothetical protein
MTIQRKTVVVPGTGGGLLFVEGSTGSTASVQKGSDTVAVESRIVQPSRPFDLPEQTVQPTAVPGQPIVSSKPPVVAVPVSTATVVKVTPAKGTPLPPPVQEAPAKKNGKGKGKGKPTIAELEAMLEALKAGATVPVQTATVAPATPVEEIKPEAFDWSEINSSKPWWRQKAMLALTNGIMGRRWEFNYVAGKKDDGAREYYWILKGETDQRHAMNAIKTVAETLVALDPTLTVGPLDGSGIVGMGLESERGVPRLVFAY